MAADINSINKKTSSILNKNANSPGAIVNTTNSSDGGSIEFTEPKNPLDPIVVFDPEYTPSAIIMPYTDYSDNKPSSDDRDPLNIEAIYTPLIKLNNKVMFPRDIHSMTITLKKFLPEIKLVVYDTEKNIQATDVPGMNNVITVILIAPVDGANKKMSMDFYIKDCTFEEDNTVTYIGELKVNGLKQVKYSQVGDKALSMYEYLEAVAKETKLGFAATEKCKEIEDRKWRQLYSETYADNIMKELEHAGIDEDSIFDAWVDNFGYIVMVNVSHIMTAKVEYTQLSTKVITGNNATTTDEEMPRPNVEEVYRLINNSTSIASKNNLHFKEYHSIVNNSEILKNGTLTKCYYLSSPCDGNLIKQEEIQIIELSVDGIEGVDEYMYENIEYLGTDQGEEGEVCERVQEMIVKNFYTKICSKMIEVTLDEPNYSLQRGMLVAMSLEEFNPRNKQAVLNNMENSIKLEESEDQDIPADETMKQRETIIDDMNGIINPALTGIYYIKDMKFDYVGVLEHVTQTLTLIKKGIQSNLTNKYTVSRTIK